MNSKTDATAGGLDTAKLAGAIGIFVAGIAAYYLLADVPALARTLIVLVAAGLGLYIASSTAIGRQTSGFLHDAQIEIRKVVWPTPAETRQTTLLVLAMVFVASLLLWGLDSLLGVVVRSVMSSGQG